jgi:flavin-dependent dehydrogenase
MLFDRSDASGSPPRPVVLGTGLTGLAISRALSARNIAHVLVGARPSDKPRLGESLNAEGSIEIARQFPEQARYFHRKRRVALFYDGHAVSFDAAAVADAPARYAPLGYPARIELLHVDRIGFDAAAFEQAVGDDHCLFAADSPVGIDYDAARDRVRGIDLATAGNLACSYVFDATNDKRFLARTLGVSYRRIGAPRRVVFAHYRATARRQSAPPPWADATALLRLDRRADALDGIAWCIPLGDYVSLGITVDPDATGANPALLLDGLEAAYARRGIAVRRFFPERGEPVDFAYEHYTHARCHGGNWLLAGPSCCQIWFPAAAGIATALIAARLAPDLICEPRRLGAVYQHYIDNVAASHAGLEWLAASDPWTASGADMARRARAVIDGNIARLGRYLDLAPMPAELAFGDALRRFYETDRRLANPVRIATAAIEAQATRLLATPAASPWTDPPLVAPLAEPQLPPDGPPAIPRVADLLSGRIPLDAAAATLTDDVALEIDAFRVHGLARWRAWADWLRRSPRIENPRLVPLALTSSGAEWRLTARWEGEKEGNSLVSAEFAMTFALVGDRVALMRTRRADHAFVTGDGVLPAPVFAVLLAGFGRKAA